MGKHLMVMFYDGTWYDTPVDVSDEGLKKISRIEIEVISGDHIAKIEYTDGRDESYDSSMLCRNYREDDYYDGSKVIYNPLRGINLIDAYLSTIHSNDVFNLG